MQLDDQAAGPPSTTVRQAITKGTSIENLKSIKRQFRSLAKATSENESLAAKTIYSSSIAAAIVQHGISISKQSDQNLQNSWSSLLNGELPIPDALEDIILRAMKQREEITNDN